MPLGCKCRDVLLSSLYRVFSIVSVIVKSTDRLVVRWVLNYRVFKFAFDSVYKYIVIDLYKILMESDVYGAFKQDGGGF